MSEPDAEEDSQPLIDADSLFNLPDPAPEDDEDK